MEHADLARALFEAFARNDANAVRNLCTQDMKASQNQGPAMDLDGLLAFSGAVQRVVQNFRYEAAIRSATDTGFVEEHKVRGSLPNGGELNLAVCVVADVQDGKVSSLREYVDSAAAAGLMNALTSDSPGLHPK